MADLIAKGLQIPNLESGQASPADVAGFIRVYARGDQLFGRKPDGTEVAFSGDVGVISIVEGVGIDVDQPQGDVTITNADRGSVAVSEHVALPDPHNQYAVNSFNQILTNAGAVTADGRATQTFIAGGNAGITTRSVELQPDLIGVAIDNADRGTVAVTAHEALPDPHPQYTTTDEAAAAAPVQSVNGDTGEVRVSFIEAPAGSVTPANVIASDNSIAFNFNNQPRAVYRTGGVDYFPNDNNPYSYRFRDADGSNFAGLRAPDVVPADYFSMLPSEIGQVGQVLSVNAINGNQQALGYVTPGHPIDLYTTGGLVGRETRIKQFVATVQSNGAGDFTVDWSAAGFTQPPFSVMVTAFSANTGTVRDRSWATMRTDFTATQGQGYTLRGNRLVFVLGGGGETVRTAPNVVVHVVAWGV